MLEELDYVLVPEESWTRLVELFGLAEGQEPIARTVRQAGLRGGVQIQENPRIFSFKWWGGKGFFVAVLRIRIRDPGCLFDPWIRDSGSGMGKKTGSGTGIRDDQPGSYFRELRNQFFGLNNKLFDVDPGSGPSGIEKFGSGMENIRIRINIPNPQRFFAG
jgi:hypothetical protein